MSNLQNKILTFGAAVITSFAMLITSILIPAPQSMAEENTTVLTEPVLTYSVHAQDIGWMETVGSNEITGTTGKSKRLEAIAISLNTTGLKASDGSDLTGAIVGQAHVQDYGWMEEVVIPADSKTPAQHMAEGTYIGTSGKSKRVEGVTLKLTGKIAEEYNIVYRVHVQDIGWLGWQRNGSLAGTTGRSKRLEAIQIKLEKKDSSLPSVTYQVHAQDYGWMSYVSAEAGAVFDDSIAGTTGSSKRLEALKISLNSPGITGGISYSVHCQDYGWMEDVSDGAIAGTYGESKRLEAIKITLTGDISDYYDIYYRTHCQNVGWLDWAKNGQEAGTSNGSLRMEAIQIALISKGDAAPGSTATPYRKIQSLSDIPGELVIKVNKQCNTVTIYKGTVAYKAMVCSTGAATPIGSFRLGEKYRWHNLFYNSWGQYCTRITGHILFHSVPYYSPNARDLETAEFNKLGTEASAGCIRLQFADAKWISDNCPSGTRVIIYNDPNPGPLGKPTAPVIPANQTWDPTDNELYSLQ